MRLTKQNKIVVGVISLVLVLTVGYALFSETLNINGTAKASGNFNLIFSEVLRNNVKKEGATIDVDNITIKDESKTLSIGDVTLNYPSAYVKVPAKIKNEGTIDAVLKGIRVENTNASEIEVSYDGVKKDELFKSKEEKEITITIRWKEESNTPVEKQDFNIYLDYEQAPDGYVPPAIEQSDLFTWDGPTIVSGLTDKGIAEVKANGGKLVIPEGVTEIAGATSFPGPGDENGTIDRGFSPLAIGKLDMNTATEEQLMENMIITSVEFPSSLKKIGMAAFSFNMNLTGKLALPEGLEEIGDFAFCYSNITDELVIPNNVETIGKSVFVATKITSLKLGQGLKTIESGAFYGCESLSGKLIIPDGVETIAENSFGYTKITSLHLGSGLKTIGKFAFSDCESLTSELIIPDNVIAIEEQAFRNSGITSLKIGKGLTKIETYTFDSCNLTGELFIPDNITSINGYAFTTNKITNVSIAKNTSYEGASFDGYGVTISIRD